MSGLEIEFLAPSQTQPLVLNPSFYCRFFKRFLDIVLTVITLLTLAPLFLILALAIKLHSPGPVFYKQTRIGKDGQPFEMFKFRTMQVGNNSQHHRQYVQNLIRNNISPAQLGLSSLKLKADPRITGVGKIMRQFSVDEIPQLINVLRGEMSIVGPRPPLPYEHEIYSNWHAQRLLVLPGITGLWQVTAHNLVSFEEMVEIDLTYIQNLSLGLDLKIMLLTPWEMIRGKGTG
ncbi:MAG: sugar transferase [Chloroflexi bacterium]|nr:sugar transferase [Chloroflexota bacterium]